MFTGRIRFWLILALLASNLLVGVLSLVFLRSMDQRYGALLDRSIPPINSLRTLTRELGGVQRLARRIVDPAKETDWAALVKQMDDLSNAAKAHAREVSAMELFKETPHVAVIRRISTEYDDDADHFLALVRGGKLAEANNYNTDTLRPCYDGYQVALDAAAEYVQRQGETLRVRYTEDSRKFGGFLMAFAGWPVLAAALLVLVMGLLAAGLLLAVFFPRLFVREQDAA